MYSEPTLSVMRDVQRTDFGQRLAAARKHADLTQGALAKQVGMSQSAYSEAEKSGLGSAFTPQIAKACGVNVDWLATGEGEMIPRPKGLETAQAVRAGKLKGVAVVGRGNGGAMPQVIWTDSDYPVGATGEYAEDIASSDPQAFVVEVEGASMYPKYTPGNFALVEPGTEPELEDDVLVRLVTGETLIKRLVSRRSGYSLASYNDSVVLHLKPEQVAWMYYVPYPVPRRKIKSRA